MQNKMTLSKILRDSVLLFIGVLVAAYVTPSITYDKTSTLVLVALVLALFNLFLKPLLILFALPFVIMTLGLGIWLINAVLLYVAGQIVPPFNVPTFSSALIGALIISLVNVLATLIFGPRKVHIKMSRSTPDAPPTSEKRKTFRKDDDVIDI